MKRYEYEIIKIVSNEKEEINNMGKLGWMLIAVNGNVFYFIRELKGGNDHV